MLHMLHMLHKLHMWHKLHVVHMLFKADGRIVRRCPTYRRRCCLEGLFIGIQYNVLQSVWTKLSRVTTKSGWFTLHAHPQKLKRGDCQAAVFQLALHILSVDSLE